MASEPGLGPHTGTIVPQYLDPDDREPPPPERRRFPFVGLLIAVALVVIMVLVAMTIARFLAPPDRAANPSASPATQHTVTGPLGTTTEAEFQLTAGVSAVTVRAADLGDRLYRASTAADSGFVPRVAHEATQVRLRLASILENGSGDAVTMELNQRVRWRIAMIGGSESATVDLRSADVAAVSFTGGVARIELWLPTPKGSIAVSVAGGARDVVVHVPSGVPVRVGLARGASKVTVDGVAKSGLAAGTRLTPDGWNAARNRYDLDAAGGLATLVIGR